MTLSESVFLQTQLKIPEVKTGNQVKSAIQEAVAALDSNFLVLEWPTGTSKTRAALLCSQYQNVLVLCKQNEHIKTWKDEVKKWKIKLDSFQAICYSSLGKLKGKKYDVIILDEAQGFTDNRLKLLKQLKWDKLIAVSATIPDEVYQRLYSLGTPKVIKIRLENAIEWKLIPTPKVKIISVPLQVGERDIYFNRTLPNCKQTEYIDYPDYHKYNTKFVNLKVKCNEKEYYSLLQYRFEQYKDRFIKKKKQLSHEVYKAKTVNRNLGYNEQQVNAIVNGEYKSQWNALGAMEMQYYNAGKQRKDFLGSRRTSLAEKIVEMYKDKRLVVFCNSIAQCNQIAKGKPVLHSESFDKNVVERFNAGELDHLYVVKQIDESTNLSGDFTALIIVLGGSLIQAIQRLGRSLRSENCELYCFHTPGTVDDKYLANFKGGIPNEYFTHITLDEFIKQKSKP